MTPETLGATASFVLFDLYDKSNHPISFVVHHVPTVHYLPTSLSKIFCQKTFKIA